MNERRACCETQNENAVSREDVQEFYSNAALSSQDSLCCPSQYDDGDLSHIPEKVREISYGCGSPVNRAGLGEGETLVDLGSGGGIDCFIAAKFVGPTGRVVGIDMTEDMLTVARKNAELVAQNLGYRNVEFKQGFLESLPLETEAVDVVTSNCVVNLSLSKNEVFREIHRVLKPGGRFVIADIISEKEVPEAMQNNRDLWGECVAGALTLGEFLNAARNNGFHGLVVKKDYLWKEVEDIKFYSYTVEGYKHPKPDLDACCKSWRATYAGPFDTITWEGVVFPAGV
ncbi:MAG: methyltransferase domain-containing protein, partial [Nitrospinaceae bacterium]|nr:methyltransferase domain-containing protein [Nitrospinaceae bacterium]NIR53525.1 methyltransferase domain-containing protein [Nitrospinaceae bacterium]NIS83924.1 methyltransferase domain-containing protein [Nitrospinaceae bacterium]NIT80732.1 methyltransferase domain-containing protein [Nitrospinaceae bacterium]NIU43041.1 methyltransferase domain-containing protein [Nitrospinaceae bacterium]